VSSELKLHKNLCTVKKIVVSNLAMGAVSGYKHQFYHTVESNGIIFPESECSILDRNSLPHRLTLNVW